MYAKCARQLAGPRLQQRNRFARVWRTKETQDGRSYVWVRVDLNEMRIYNIPFDMELRYFVRFNTRVESYRIRGAVGSQNDRPPGT